MLKTVSTDKAPAAVGPYSQAIICGNFLFVSGQIPLAPVSGAVCGDTIETQARQVMENMKMVLEAGGASFDGVVKTTCFLQDMGDFPVFNSIYEQYFVSKPARSCVAVANMPKGVLCEVEAIATRGE